MRLAGVAALVLVVAGVPATPAVGANRSVDVQISVHLRSDYRFAYDYTATDDPDCPITYATSSHVVADMTTDRRARYRIERFPTGGRPGYAFLKRLGGGQREALGVDMTVKMTRRAQGGSTSPCGGHHDYPQVNCTTRSWPAYGEVGMGRGVFEVGIRESASIGIERTMELDKWRSGGCGYDTTHAQEYITQTRNLDTGKVKPTYHAPISIRRLFAARPRVMRLRARLPFEQGAPNQNGGGSTEVRTVAVTIRKLRRR